MVFGFFDMVNSEGFLWRRGLRFVGWIVFFVMVCVFGLVTAYGVVKAIERESMLRHVEMRLVLEFDVFVFN